MATNLPDGIQWRLLHGWKCRTGINTGVINPLKIRIGISRHYIIAVVILLGLTACGGGGGGGGGSGINSNVQVSWTANRESAVNSPGGGYKVYSSTSPGFNIASASFVDVPNAGGATPTSTTLSLFSGTHYIKVIAYSTLNPAGSAPSAEIAITAP